MKRMLKTFVALTASAVLWAGQANAVLIELVPGTTGPVASGETVQIDVMVSELGGDVVTAFDMDILFDSTLLSFDFIGYTGFLGIAGLPGDLLADAWYGIGITGDILDFWMLSLLSDAQLATIQNGDAFLMFTLNFTANADAESTDFSFIWDRFNDVKCSDNAVCFPTSVPEPGTLSLLGLGLLAMGMARRRRKL